MTAQEMQEQWLKNNKPKQCEDGGYVITDIMRKSKSHRDSLTEETKITEYKYDGLQVEDNDGRVLLISFKTRRYKERGDKAINIYNRKILSYTCKKSIPPEISEETICDKLQSGEYKVVTNKEIL